MSSTQSCAEPDLGKVLRELASSGTRPAAARLRQLFNQIEEARAAGVQHKTIVATLREHGLQISDATYYGTLRRIRAKARNAPTTTAAPPRAPSFPAVVPAPSIHQTGEKATHSPAALDQVISSTPDLDALTRHATRKANK